MRIIRHDKDSDGIQWNIMVTLKLFTVTWRV